jgi:hypothetical protein
MTNKNKKQNLSEEKIMKLEEKMKKQNKNKCSKSGDSVKVCPKCGSENVGVEAEILAPTDFCRDCGFNSRSKDVISILQFPTKSNKSTKSDESKTGKK